VYKGGRSGHQNGNPGLKDTDFKRCKMEFPHNEQRKRAVRLVMWLTVLIALLAHGVPEPGDAAGKTVPTFRKDVAPILFNHCVKCHSSGEIASNVPLASYDTVRAQAELIKQKVMLREMPPWPVDPARSVKFRNDARLSQQDIDTLVAWVNAGARKGNDGDLPPMPKFEDGWMHPQGLKPDLVLSLPGLVHVPAKGEIPYVRMLVKVPFLDDRWIVASQTRAGNPAVVHHIAVTEISLDQGVSPADLDRLAGLARQRGFSNAMLGAQPAVTDPLNPELFDMLGVYTPGTTFENYPEGTAKLLKGGENVYLNFNMHYRTDGGPETDRSMLALWFQPGPPKHQLFRVPGAGETIIANEKELLTDAPGTKAEGTQVAIPPIPPHAANYEVTGVTGYTEPVTIYQFQPHAHAHAKDFTYTVVYPDGREEIVLSVPKYDHRWQMAYELETPLKLPAGGKLVVTAHYGNSQPNMSQMNMANPESEKEVYFRDMNSTKDEMFSPFITYSIDGRDPAKPSEAAQAGERHGEDNPSQKTRLEEEGVLQIGEAVGCLQPAPHGDWLLTNASDPEISQSQATTSVALKAAEAKPLGIRRYTLLGASVFNPASHPDEEVAVKGILIKGIKESRINVTSLQMVAPKCIK
jgi:hypothetical protein